MGRKRCGRKSGRSRLRNVLTPLFINTIGVFLDLDAKIYVAGHRGLVGSALIRNLRSKGYSNIVTRTHKELDLIDQRAVQDFFSQQKPQYVFLAAARVGGILANSTYRGEFIYQNLMIQSNILHQSMIHGADRLVFLGSSCIYPKNAPQPIREEYLLTAPLEPTNSPYAIAKIAGVEMCDAYNKQYGTSFLTVMPTNLYGPGDNFDLETSHVLPAMLRKFHLAKLASEKRHDSIDADEKRFGNIPFSMKKTIGLSLEQGNPVVTLWGTGSPYREFLHVDDMADACVFLMFENRATAMVNIGVGKDITTKELATRVADTVSYSGEIVWDISKPDGTFRKLLNIDRLGQMGWKARISLKEGLRQTYEWYRQQLP